LLPSRRVPFGVIFAAMRRIQALTVVGVSLFAAAVQANTFVKQISLAPHARPESITQGWGGKFYVSIQNTPDGALPDGEIVQVDIATGVVTSFVGPGNGLVNPRGLAFTGKFLVVTDTTNVWKIDQAGAVTLLAGPPAFPFPPVFFNDAAPEHGGRAVFITEMGPGRNVQRDPAGFLWPTDSPQAEAIPTAARIYRITLDGKVTNVMTPTRKILVTNGVTEAKKGKGNRLLALDFFNGNVVEVRIHQDEKNIIAAGPFRGADGIEQSSCDGTIFVTSFENGRVWRMGADGENVVKLFDEATDLGPGNVARQTTADLALDEKAGLLYVPDTLHSTIIVLKTE
jgi:sugar lactone lactonase YvrE